MSSAPRVAIGVPMYNGAAYVEEAVGTLLAQTYEDVGFVLVDDGSIDTTPAILERYVRADSRVRYHRNETRLGMVRNWVRAFELALEEFPSAEYFAWGSDHDAWHRRWLESLVRKLDESPDAVLAYPLAVGLDDEGHTKMRARRGDTADIVDPRARLEAVAERGRITPGNAVYGLFRVDALRRCGVYRLLRDPDRLLMTELSAHGVLVQADEVLWYRRKSGDKPTQERQRASFYPEGAPLRAFVPWPITHGAAMAWSLGVQGRAQPAVSRGMGLQLAWDATRYATRIETERRFGRGRMANLRRRLVPERLSRALSSRFGRDRTDLRLPPETSLRGLVGRGRRIITERR